MRDIHLKWNCPIGMNSSQKGSVKMKTNSCKSTKNHLLFITNKSNKEIILMKRKKLNPSLKHCRILMRKIMTTSSWLKMRKIRTVNVKCSIRRKETERVDIMRVSCLMMGRRDNSNRKLRKCSTKWQWRAQEVVSVLSWTCPASTAPTQASTTNFTPNWTNSANPGATRPCVKKDSENTLTLNKVIKMKLLKPCAVFKK